MLLQKLEVSLSYLVCQNLWIQLLRRARAEEMDFLPVVRWLKWRVIEKLCQFSRLGLPPILIAIICKIAAS